MIPAAKILEAEISDAELREIITKFLQEKGWQADVSIEGKKIVLFPNYFFEFDCLAEGKRFHGKAVIDEYRRVNEQVGEKIIRNLKPLNEKYAEYEIKPMETDSKKIEEIAKLHIAAIHKAEKENIIISNIIPFYVPKVIAEVRFDSQNLSLSVNLFSREIVAEIPEKRKTTKQVVVESLTELKSPKAWIINFKELLSIVSKFSKRHSVLWFIVVVLLVVALVLVLLSI
ncbi:MAG: hypothetical protein J7L14_00220 [Candidatus Diapherotrites archaeon]|nr:hypothetical protein [Candidatus Diapherotrites archaeon]